MKLGWGAGPILALLALAIVLVSISVLLELTSVIRLALEGASTDSALISQTLLSQIDHIVRQTESPPLDALREDPRLDGILQAAIARSPSVVFVAICDSAGRAVRHTTPERVGSTLDSLPALPQARELSEATRILVTLSRSPQVYDVSTPLLLGERPFATIRVGIATVLLRERVATVFRRGLAIAAIQIGLAVGLGFLLVGILMKRIRLLETGVAALREGRFDRRIPVTGVDEFSRLARDLNLLSEQFQKEQEDRDSSIGSVRRTVELLGEGVLTLGPDGRVALLNGTAAAILGVDTATAIGQQIDQVLEPADPVLRLVDQLSDSADPTLSVPLPPNKAGENYVAIGHRIAEKGASGGVLVEFKETAALAKIHSLIDHSSVLSRLGQMAAGVAHEIRNPLQTINFELGSLRHPQNLAAEQIDEHVETAVEAIQRLERAVSGFLKVARLRELTYVRAPINELLEEAHRAMEGTANLSGLDLDLDLDVDLPDASCDLEVLRQAVENIVKNAIQALPSRDGKIELTSRSLNGEIRISVTDHGPGIPPEHVEKVSDLYFTTKKAGSGVGLALVRQAVELHGGRLEIDSEIGTGTTVTLAIPIDPVA